MGVGVSSHCKSRSPAPVLLSFRVFNDSFDSILRNVCMLCSLPSNLFPTTNRFLFPLLLWIQSIYPHSFLRVWACACAHTTTPPDTHKTRCICFQASESRAQTPRSAVWAAAPPTTGSQASPFMAVFIHPNSLFKWSVPNPRFP